MANEISFAIEYAVTHREMALVAKKMSEKAN